MTDQKIISITILSGCIIVFLLSWGTALWAASGHFNCLVKEYIGIPCPLCGLSGGFKYLIQGAVGPAFFASPLSVFFGLSFLFIILLSVYCLIVNSNRMWLVVPWRIFFCLTGAVILLLWIYKVKSA